MKGRGRTRGERIFQVGLAGLIGWGVGWVVGILPEARFAASHDADALPGLVERIPLPHHVPEHPDGASLRFAMVHDVLHERFTRHPSEYYAERNRLDQARLAALPVDSPARWPLIDNIGVGLDRQGQAAAAIDLLRAKLADQLRVGQTGRDLYTSYANLGTFLIHANLGLATQGDVPAQERFRAGIASIRQAVEVNPAAHFGRERWQVAITEYLLAAMADPSVLRTWDFLGNRLDLPIESMLNRESNWSIHGGYGRATTPAFSRGQISQPALYFEPGVNLADPALWPTLCPIRAMITKVGAEEGWEAVAVPSHRTPVPFDEPTLGIIGMWRQGGGANPHFALALGETMLRVGQRRLAWAAFERAGRLAERYWPDPALVAFLQTHCRSRQAEIEATLAYLAPADSSLETPWQLVSPHRDDDAPAQLRDRFDAELEFGAGYRRRYQDFERARLAAGVAVDDPHLDDTFRTGRTPIASPVGPEEMFAGVFPRRVRDFTVQHSRATGLCGAGIAALLMALVTQLFRPPFVPQVAPIRPVMIDSTDQIKN